MLKKILTSKIFLGLVFLSILFFAGWFWPAEPKVYDEYGVTFSAKYAEELGLDPREMFDVMVDDLGVEKVRLVAYWDEIEKENNEYDFSSLDWQIEKAEEKGLDVILAFGRRVPRWPECHVPGWAYKMEWKDQKEELLFYVKEVVNRYKDNESIKVWQVENEPFLTAYVPEICGPDLDKDLLDREIELVKSLDPDRPILMTDSGNLGLWLGAYKRGDQFGSTFYVYLTNPNVGEVRTIINHNYYRFKKLLASLFYGDKKTYLIEVSIEPWLLKPITESPVEEQLEFMNIDRIKEIIEMSAKTRFDEQYLWGVEWWYYLKEQGHPEIWDFMKKVVFKNGEAEFYVD